MIKPKSPYLLDKLSTSKQCVCGCLLSVWLSVACCHSIMTQLFLPLSWQWAGTLGHPPTGLPPPAKKTTFFPGLPGVPNENCNTYRTNNMGPCLGIVRMCPAGLRTRDRCALRPCGRGGTAHEESRARATPQCALSMNKKSIPPPRHLGPWHFPWQSKSWKPKNCSMLHLINVKCS